MTRQTTAVRPRLTLPVIGVGVAVVVAVVTVVVSGVFNSGSRPGSGTWTMFMGNFARTGFAADETTITPGNVHKLKPRWDLVGKATISDQATLDDRVLYWGSWDGYEHATDAGTGEELWRTFLGEETDPNCAPPHVGIGSTPAIGLVPLHGAQTKLLFVGGGDGSVYALRASTGEKVWSRNFGSPKQGWFIWSSPALYRGSVYIGVASIGSCPLVRGAFVKLDAATGAIQARFDTVAKGCIGASVWSSPTIDASTGTVYVTTGNQGGACTNREPYAQAMLQFSASDLKLEQSWRVPKKELAPDGDFGATPTLFTAAIDGRPTRLVGAVNKNGIYYAFRRGQIASGPVWKTSRLSIYPVSVASSAWDGRRLYVASVQTKIGGRSCTASIRAIDPSTGTFVWQRCAPGGDADAALTAIPGVVFEAAGSNLYGLSAGTGSTLFKFHAYNWFYAPAMVAGGTLYIGNTDGRLYAFSIGGH
jgi:outer membrane protein assembly factor BamB